MRVRLERLDLTCYLSVLVLILPVAPDTHTHGCLFGILQRDQTGGCIAQTRVTHARTLDVFHHTIYFVSIIYLVEKVHAYLDSTLSASIATTPRSAMLHIARP